MSNRAAVCLRSWVKVNAVSPRGARKCKLMSGRADVCDAASHQPTCALLGVKNLFNEGGPHDGTRLLNYSDHAPVRRR
jgi:hypothetical protein